MATTRRLKSIDTLFGVIQADQNKVFHVFAPYPSRVEKVHVNLGDTINKGQRLLTLTNTKTLQTYHVTSVAAGVITQRLTNPGDKADQQVLLEVIDLSSVWVDLSAFPASIEKLKIGQQATIYDMHQHERVQTKISYIAPIMTGGHIARARAIIENPVGHWRPGMHIKADIVISNRQVPIAVKADAIQSFHGGSAVFIKNGNTFEARVIELGESDGQFVEVLKGLKPWTTYVTTNSFLIKSDLLKAGATHDH
jgi:cobalt-zinc-cadmium efflux system membrane fusion protein